MLNRFPLDNDYYVSPYDLHSYQRWRREKELEARRRAERSYRLKREQEELARHRRRQEELRRQAELEREEEGKRRERLKLQEKANDTRRQHASKQESSRKPERRSKYDHHPIVRGSDGRLYRLVPQEHDPFNPTIAEVPTGEVKPQKTTKVTESVKVTVTKEPELRERPARKSTKPRRQRVTIVVEDASDSEAEDEYSSVWRNRRPSPGQWLEPVED